MPLLASALLAALATTLLFIIPTLRQIEEPWNIVVVSQTLALLRTTFIVTLAHAFILGIPLFLALRSITSTGAVTCALGGLLLGAMPFGALALVSMDRPPECINWWKGDRRKWCAGSSRLD